MTHDADHRSIIALALFSFCLLTLLPLVLFPQDSSPLALLLGAIISAAAIFSWRAARTTPGTPASEENGERVHDAALFCALAAVSAFIRLSRLGHFSVWLDEAAQVMTVANPDSGAVLGAITRHQPPLDYLLTQFDVRLFGVNELGTRFHSAALSALTPPLFFVLLRRLRVSTLVSAFGGLCLAVDPTLVYYSQEGRPYSLAVFLEIIYLSAAAAFVDEDEATHAGTLFLAAAAVLFALSIVFQPPIVMAAVCAVALVCVPRFGRRALVFLAAHAAALLAYAPFHFEIAKKSQVYLQPRWVDSAVEFFKGFAPGSLDIYLAIWPRPAVALFAACAVAAAALKARKTATDAVPSRAISPSAICAIFGAVLIIAIPLHAFAYGSTIRWPFFASRYFITFLPIFYLAGCAGVEALWRRVSAASSRATAFTGVALGAALLPGGLNASAIVRGRGPNSAIGLPFFLASEHARLCFSGKPSSDFRAIFAHLAARGDKDDIALPLTFRAPGELTLDGFLTADFYYHRAGRPMEMPVFSLDHSGRFVASDFLRSALHRRTPPRRVFFVSVPEFNSYSLLDADLDELRRVFPQMRSAKFGGNFDRDAVVVELPLGGDPRGRILEFYGLLARRHARQPWIRHIEEEIRALEGVESARAAPHANRSDASRKRS